MIPPPIYSPTLNALTAFMGAPTCRRAIRTAIRDGESIWRPSPFAHDRPLRALMEAEAGTHSASRSPSTVRACPELSSLRLLRRQIINNPKDARSDQSICRESTDCPIDEVGRRESTPINAFALKGLNEEDIRRNSVEDCQDLTQSFHRLPPEAKIIRTWRYQNTMEHGKFWTLSRATS